MAKYIKSHSNYVIKGKHQNTNDGIIYERDITTIGGRNQFSKGQVPIYQSGNFVITVNGDTTTYKKKSDSDWYKSEFGEIWTNDVVDLFDKSYDTSDDTKIVIKKDFYNLRDYAYYGSCSEMVRASIDDILKTYPGELYIPLDTIWEIYDGDELVSVQYTEDAAKFVMDSNPRFTSASTDVGQDVFYTTRTEGESVDEFNHTEQQANRFELKDESGNTIDLIAIDNPFDIDIHSKKVPQGANRLKYFAEDGNKNYVAYKMDDNGQWDFDNPYSIDWIVTYSGLGEELIVSSDFECTIGGVEVDTVDLCKGSGNVGVEMDFKATESLENTEDFDRTKVLCPGDYLGYATIQLIKETYEFSVTPSSQTFNALSETNGDVKEFFIDDRQSELSDTKIKIHIFMGDDNKMMYFVNKEDLEDNNMFRIRPNNDILEEYFFNLDSFERILLNRDSNPPYTATFEIIDENEDGYYTYTDSFTFPTTYGGYNLGSYGLEFDNYVHRLSKISEFYDERFSDNMWRSLTHEAIKNFDWTFKKEYDTRDAEESLEGGQKIQKILRLYAREFDEIKNYIDAIANNNTTSYDNINNLPDYFYTDELEQFGWDVKLIYPYTLKEYINDKTSIPFDFHHLNDEDANECDYVDFEPTNKYVMPDSDVSVNVTRIFTQDYDSKMVQPYYIDDEHIQYNPNYFRLSDDTIDLCNEETTRTIGLEISSSGECETPSYYYRDSTYYSYIDVSNEFLKRLIMNSKDIIRHKGTIESIEMIMALFNMKKDRDYSIKEYTMFSPYETDEWSEGLQDYLIEWLNTTKLISYRNTDTPYYGLPMSYRDVVTQEGNEERRLYPHYQNGVEYDGGTYYQMNGGWMRKRPFVFDNKNNILPEGYGDSERTSMLFTETVRNIRAVQTINDLLNTPSLAVHDGDVVIVNDLTGRYAIIDGHPYNLYYEDLGNVITEEGTKKLEYSYFYASVQNSSLVVGNAVFYNYVVISNPYYDGKKQKIDLNDSYYEGKQIKIYVTKTIDLPSGTYTYDVTITSNSSSINTFTVFENEKYMEGNNFTHYFRINDTRFYDELSLMGWQQLRDDEYDYYALNTITDNNEGNNPHNGHMNYDNGHEYLARLQRIFKYVTDNDLIDYRKYGDLDYGEGTNELYSFGFSNLIDDDYCVKDYDKYLVEDCKCHYFGDFLKKDYDEFGQMKSDTEWRYVLDKENYENKLNSPDKHNLMHYNINDNIIKPMPNDKKSKYGVDDRNFDGVTDQILNTKRFELEIFIDAECQYSIDYLEQIKYYDSIVMHYVTQLLPSSLICTVNYKLKPKTT